MGSYLLRRLFRTLLVMVGISLLVFAFVKSLPGGPCAAILGERGTPETIATCNHNYGFDRPLFVNTTGNGGVLEAQYPMYMGRLLRGNLGEGIQSHTPVIDDLKTRFPATVELTLGALLFALLVGLPTGIIAALRRNSLWDNIATTISLVGVSMPVFWLGLLLSYFFGVKLGWLPPSSRLGNDTSIQPITGMYVLDGLLRGQPHVTLDALRHLILPSIALGSIPLAIIARITRSGLLDVLGQDYVRTARAKGLAANTVTLKHALRNALLPIVTVIGLQIGTLLGGALLTETIFSWNGIGSWLYDAINLKDAPVIQSAVIFIAAVFSIVNLLVDLSYAALDPRIQYR